jgi:hypothetical protein
VPLLEQESFSLPEHMSSLPGFSGVRVARSLVFIIMLFVLFLLAIVLSVLLRFTDSSYSFDIFRLFLSLGFFICSIFNVSVLFCRSLFVFLFFVF